MSTMLEKLESIEKRYNDLESQMADPSVLADHNKLHEVSKEHSDLKELVAVYQEFRQTIEQISDNEDLIADSDPELAEMAREELPELKRKRDELEDRMKRLLLPKDPNDSKNVILEIRAGTGGEEAMLFAGDLLRMYSRFADSKRWSVEELSSSPSDLGGFKEVIVLIQGKEVYSHLKYESGVHRVQRVPETESQGRIHTSAATVAVLTEVEENEIDIRTEDLQIDTYRASGAGGQHVNTTDSAVRITHIPTGTVVTCQDERSQIKNRSRAMKILASRLAEEERIRAIKEQADDRKGQVGSGDRSERIRTYNYPQGRITDHRIGLTLYKLPEIMEGEMDDLITQTRATFQAEALKGAGH